MSFAWLLVAYCIIVALASVGGGWLPALLRMTHLRTQLLMSFVAGLMLGIATLHLMPHAMESLGSSSRAGAAMLIGVIGMFVLLRAFHAHHHGEAPVAVDPEATLAREATDDSHARDHHHGSGHHCGGSQDSGDTLPLPKPRSLSWIGMLFGLGLHTIMDGVALGASVAADASHGAWLGLAGLGTFLAVALHKPLDAFAISSVMTSGGWSPAQRSLVNLAFGLCCPIGAGLFYFGATQLAIGDSVLGYGLALSAGFFVCIALADLLPEVHFHDHDRGKLTAALFLGVALAVGIENLPGHSHDHHHDQAEQLTPAERFRARLRGEDPHHGHDHDGHRD